VKEERRLYRQSLFQHSSPIFSISLVLYHTQLGPEHFPSLLYQWGKQNQTKQKKRLPTLEIWKNKRKNIRENVSSAAIPFLFFSSLPFWNKLTLLPFLLISSAIFYATPGKFKHLVTLQPSYIEQPPAFNLSFTNSQKENGKTILIKNLHNPFLWGKALTVYLNI